MVTVSAVLLLVASSFGQRTGEASTPTNDANAIKVVGRKLQENARKRQAWNPGRMSSPTTHVSTTILTDLVTAPSLVVPEGGDPSLETTGAEQVDVQSPVVVATTFPVPTPTFSRLATSSTLVPASTTSTAVKSSTTLQIATSTATTVGNTTTTTSSVPTVGASLINAELTPVREGEPATLRITFRQPSASGSFVILRATSGDAKGDDRSNQDYVFPSAPSYLVGAGGLEVTLLTLDDALNELDETRGIDVVDASSGSVMASVQLKILDNDRKALVDIRTMGATGDGSTDDTAAVQRSVDAARNAGGGVVLVPPGTYLVTSVRIGPGLTMIGQGGVLKRPGGQGKWVRTLTTDGNPYLGPGPSAPLVLEGLRLDGNRIAQGSYANSELEQAHLVMLYAAQNSPGKLIAYVDQCSFVDNVADGLSIYTNVSARVTDSVARDSFRGGLVVGGGNTDIYVDGFTTLGPTVRTGVDFEVDGAGFGGTFDVHADLRNLDIDADFDLGFGDSTGSTAIIDGLVMRAPPFTSYTPRASILIRNSSLAFGAADGYVNRLLFPTNFTIEDSTVTIVSESLTIPAGMDLWFAHQSIPLDLPGKLALRRVSFVRKGDVGPTYGILKRVVRAGDEIQITGVNFDGRLTAPVGV